MKIAILGTRGIPNNYGGFEQFAEYLSVGLAERGHDVTVYNTSFHEYKADDFKKVRICKKYSPEKLMGAPANFIYDFLCLKDALKKEFDIIYELGYHSNAPSYYLLNKNTPVVITNMDGLEWKRSKWNLLTRKLIRRLERLAVNKSDYIISDNPAIRDYYKKEFERDSFYIPYGANSVNQFDKKILSSYELIPDDYFLLIARLESENNIELILDGFRGSGDSRKFMVIGNKDTRYGRFLQRKYSGTNIFFAGAIYDKSHLDSIRHFASLYFHGHSVGGTNPSLLEAMAAGSLISAHDNPFNRAILNENALFFINSRDIVNIIRDLNRFDSKNLFISNNKKNIRDNYSWETIISDYEKLFTDLSEQKTK